MPGFMQRFTTMRVATGCVFLTCFLLGSLVAAAGADAPSPVNDDYLKSLRLEDPQHRTPRQPTLNVQDATAATVQTDLLAPTGAGGGPEQTSCAGVSYGRTLWYDITPDQHGAVRLQSAGRDGVIALYKYDPRTLRLGKRIACVNQSGVQDQMDAWLDKGEAYTVQLGGVDAGAGPAGGEVQFTEQFLEDRDRDKVLDAVDKCVGTKGVARLNGCLPDVNVAPTFSWRRVAGGLKVTDLSIVDTDHGGGTATAGCCGHHASRRLRTAKTSFTKNFAGAPVPLGSILTVTVRRAGAIGVQFRWRITSKGAGVRQTKCLVPSTGRPPKAGRGCQ